MNHLYNFNIGRYGEIMALEYLKKIGYNLIEKNYRCQFGIKGEIDLVMVDGETLVFVEVKYKSDDSLGLPEEMIDRRKITQVHKIAEYFISNRTDISRLYERYRIDAVCILGKEIRHYINIE